MTKSHFSSTVPLHYSTSSNVAFCECLDSGDIGDMSIASRRMPQSFVVNCELPFWDLPDVLLFKIVTFAAAPTNRATVLCHTIAPLCRSSYHKILNGDEITVSSLWDMIFVEDYHGSIHQNRSNRECKRLRRGPIHRVREAHRLIKDNTEIAYFYLSEMSNSCNGASKLTRARMMGLLNEYGPNLQLNQTVSSGGLFLVEVCRAKNVRESVILRCVHELVEQRGVMVDLRTSESESSCLTALCVAAARGLHTVVAYLLQKGAALDIISSGRFALHTRPKKSIRCHHQTALEFARTMHQAETNEGCGLGALKGLEKCMSLLRR